MGHHFSSVTALLETRVNGDAFNQDIVLALNCFHERGQICAREQKIDSVLLDEYGVIRLHRKRFSANHGYPLSVSHSCEFRNGLGIANRCNSHRLDHSIASPSETSDNCSTTFPMSAHHTLSTPG